MLSPTAKPTFGTNHTLNALLEQLVYIDNFVSSANSDSPSTYDFEFDDHRLSLELATFADDSFVFADEEKPNFPDPEGHQGALAPYTPQPAFTLPPPSDSHAPKSEPLDDSSLLEGRDYQQALPPLETPHQSLRDPSRLGSSTYPESHRFRAPTLDAEFSSRSILDTLPKVPVPAGAKSSLVAAGLSDNQIDALAALIARHQLLATVQPTPMGPHGFQPPSHPLSQPPATSDRSNQPPSYGALETQETIPRSDLVPNPLRFDRRPSQTQGGSQRSLSTTESSSFREVSFSTDSSPAHLVAEPERAAEGDKRRRNTQASARFRIKKKMKEQQLEATVNNLNEISGKLQVKIQQLEMENKLLRNLIVDKNHQRNLEELADLKRKATQGPREGEPF